MPQIGVEPEAYCFRLELWKHPGRRLFAEVPLGPGDFARGVDHACFDGLRRGRLTAYDPAGSRARVEPQPARVGGGSPQARGFDVVVPTPDGGEHRVGFGIDYFQSRVVRIFTEALLARRLSVTQGLLFQLTACPEGAAPAPDRPARFTVESVSAPVPVLPGSRKALGETEAWDDPRPDELPVLIHRAVIDEALDEARRCPEQEVGGLLLGHLRRDAESREVFLEVTCHLPARATEATHTSVTFTPDTWADARRVAQLRGRGEIFVGWVHSHPFRFEGEDLPDPVPPELATTILFYSPDDLALMEQSFARPFMVGLLTAVEPRLGPALGHPPVRLFGWRGGEIHARGFEVVRG
jgi:hypothetical protein